MCDLHCVVVEAVCVCACACVTWCVCIHNCLASCCEPIRGVYTQELREERSSVTLTQSMETVDPLRI